MITTADIARVAHEVNRAYCASIGDNSQLPWDEAPDWQKESAVKGIEMHLANPDTTPEQSHEAWMAHKAAEGWVYGEVKDPEAKTHPAMLPYDQLPTEQRTKDYLFKAVVEQLGRIAGQVNEASESPYAGPLQPPTPGHIAKILTENVGCSTVISTRVAMENLASALSTEQLHIDAQNTEA